MEKPTAAPSPTVKANNDHWRQGRAGSSRNNFSPLHPGIPGWDLILRKDGRSAHNSSA